MREEILPDCCILVHGSHGDSGERHEGLPLGTVEPGRFPGGPGGAPAGLGRHSMATFMRFRPGSVETAVSAGSHDDESRNRVRRSSTESCWISMNSGIVIETVTAKSTDARRLRE